MKTNPPALKLYAISRVLLFQIRVRFIFELSEAGELFASGYLSEQMTRDINAVWPQAVRPLCT